MRVKNLVALIYYDDDKFKQVALTTDEESTLLNFIVVLHENKIKVMDTDLDALYMLKTKK